MNQVGPKGGCTRTRARTYLTKVAIYVTFFKGLKSRPGERDRRRHHRARPTPYQVELRTPPGGGTAHPGRRALVHVQRRATVLEVADPSTRLKQFLDQFPNRSTFTDDLPAGPLRRAHADRAAAQDRHRQPVHRGQARRRRSGHGRRRSTTARSRTSRTSASRTRPRASSPRCDQRHAAGQPCWHIVPDPRAARRTTSELKIDRAPAGQPHIIANCMTDALERDTLRATGEAFIARFRFRRHARSTRRFVLERWNRGSRSHVRQPKRRRRDDIVLLMQPQASRVQATAAFSGSRNGLRHRGRIRSWRHASRPRRAVRRSPDGVRCDRVRTCVASVNPIAVTLDYEARPRSSSTTSPPLAMSPS